MSIYEGILHIQHPSELTNPTINYIVLGLAMIFESYLVHGGVPCVQNGEGRPARAQRDPPR